MMLISTPISSAFFDISCLKTSIVMSELSSVTIIIITKLPERIVCVISSIFILCSARKELTLEIIPTLSLPTTVIIAFMPTIIQKINPSRKSVIEGTKLLVFELTFLMLYKIKVYIYNTSLERLKFQAASLKLKSSNARKIAFGRPKMTKYEKISLAISIALLILSLLSYFKM